MQRPRAVFSINERLRRVLEAALDSGKEERLEQLRQCRETLSHSDFRRLFETDTTWGDFGERRQHYDAQLHVMATTLFVPLEKQTAHDDDDITLLGTPIYRVLLALTAIILKENGFEGYGARDLVLPHRPCMGTELNLRYGSLLDVTCSVWLEICHAYVREESPTRVEELYCFNVDRTRANYIWVDYSTESGAASVRYTSLASLSNPLCLVLSPMEEPLEDDADSKPDFSVCLQACAAHPWTYLVAVSPAISAYVLLTRDSGTYVSFHRVVEGRFIRYPLWFHLLDTTTPPISSSPLLVSPRRGPSCAVCGKQGPGLIEDPMDIEHGLLYCNRVCIGQMDHIRQLKAKAEADARTMAARQQGVPPGMKLSPRPLLSKSK
jgi:hypothetical protein